MPQQRQEERKLEKYVVKDPTPLPSKEVQKPAEVRQWPTDNEVDEDDESAGFFDTITNSTVAKDE